MWKKLWFNYDPEAPALWIHPFQQRTHYDVRLTDSIGVQFDDRHRVLGVEFLWPEKQLYFLTGQHVTKSFLSKLTECKLAMESNDGLIAVHFALHSKQRKHPLIGTLTIPESLYANKIKAIA